MDKAERLRTRLLLAASALHLRLTLEELEVGTINTTHTGVVKSVDDWTERQLDYSQVNLTGVSITFLFAGSASQFSESLHRKIYGFAGRFELRSRSGSSIPAALVLVPSLEPHRYSFSVIYTVVAGALD